MLFDTNSLYASLIWGTIGGGLLMYGKKQSRAPAIIGGLALIALTFFVTAPLMLTLSSAAIVAGSWAAMRHGY